MQNSTAVRSLSTPTRSQYARVTREMLRSGLSHAAVRILCEILLEHYNDGARKDYKALISDTCMSRTQVYRAVKELKDSGMLYERNSRFFVTSIIPDTGQFIPNTGQENPTGGTSLVIADKTTDTIQPESENMGKIIGEIRRSAQVVSEQSNPTPRSARPLPAPDDIMLLEAWFEQKFLQPRQALTARVRTQWRKLVELYGDVASVQAACERAWARKDKLCTDEYPIWGLQTVLFFANYKDKDRMAKTAENEAKQSGIAQIERLISEHRYVDARTIISMFDVQPHELSGIADERTISEVFAIVIDEPWNKVGKNTGDVSAS